MSQQTRMTRRSLFAVPAASLLGAFSAGLLSRSPTASLIGNLWCSKTWAEEAIAPKKHALLVAVTRYEGKPMNQPQPLQFPEDDARAISTVLIESGYTVDTLLGSQATQANIHAELAKLKDRGNDEGIVLLGFFGHGVEYELPSDSPSRVRGRYESYFCPWDVPMRYRQEDGRVLLDRDGKTKLMEPDPERCVGMSRVFQELNKSKAGHRVIIADCCRNDPNAARAFGANIMTSDIADGTAAFFACKSGQKAYEDSRSRHGVFTSALLDAIRNHSGPKSLTMNELGVAVASDVEERVRKLNGKLQTPHPIVSGVVDLLIRPGIANPQIPVGPPRVAVDPRPTPPTDQLRLGQLLTVRSLIGPGILSTADDGIEPAGKAMAFDVGESVVVLEATARGVRIANYTVDGPGTRVGWLTNEAIVKHLSFPR